LTNIYYTFGSLDDRIDLETVYTAELIHSTECKNKTRGKKMITNMITFFDGTVSKDAGESHERQRWRKKEQIKPEG